MYATVAAAAIIMATHVITKYDTSSPPLNISSSIAFLKKV
jgi:hypothetical protein